MPWDFETDADYQAKLDWAETFVREECQPVDRVIDHGWDMKDPVRQALVAGIVYFARTSGCQLIAEGIETSMELEQLNTLGVALGRGFLLGRPTPLTVDIARGRAS